MRVVGIVDVGNKYHMFIWMPLVHLQIKALSLQRYTSFGHCLPNGVYLI